jgi:hypothetical protein
MELRLLKELVKKGEGEHLEFKLKSNHPEKIVREVVAFANSGGGKLFVGVGDDKTIKGLKDADEDEYTLTRAIDKYIFPKISFRKERVAGHARPGCARADDPAEYRQAALCGGRYRRAPGVPPRRRQIDPGKPGNEGDHA